ncbi:MAG: Thiol:disulfide interchange protein TlpA [Acidobacteria bacterium ADurb.Bin340]|nr:MAG: Thiol:disulfide interchange protein TlpA [Acidobacteria bacterium ADurb.Bin340]
MLRRLVLIVLPALLLGCGLGRDEGPGDPSGRKRVSHATFADVSGQARTLAEFGGKVVLIDVWATWCPPCRKSLPEVASLQKRGGEDFVVLAVSVDKGGWGDVTPFLQANSSLGLEAHVPGPGEGLKPFGSITAIPTTLVVDRQGRLRERWSGYAPGRAEQALAAALKEP